jgi:hypothetical protein
MAISLISDGILILLLVVTLAAVYRFNRKLAELRQGREAFEKLIAEFRQATGQADQSLQQLRVMAETRGRDLQQRTETAGAALTDLQRAGADLKLLIDRADMASDRLEEAVAQSRVVSQSLAAQKTMSEAGGALRREPLVNLGNGTGTEAVEPAPIALSPTKSAAEVAADEAKKASRNSVLSSLVGIR